MREGEVWVDRPAQEAKLEADRRAKAEDVRSQFPSNRQGRRAAERKIHKLGLK